MHAVTSRDPDDFSTLIAFERDSIPAGAAPLVHAPMSDRLSAGSVRPSTIPSFPGGGGRTEDPLGSVDHAEATS